MFRQLLCLSLLLFGTLVAEQIDNIEFQLPTSQQWELKEHVTNSLGHSAIYLLLEKEEDEQDDFDNDTFQLFSTQFLRLPFSNDNPEDFEKWMQIAMPFFDIHFNLIARDEDSMTVELFGYDDDNLELYTLIRKIRSENGVVLLTYSATFDVRAQKIQNEWIPLLLKAKPVAAE
jgi:hypothetical protein